MKQHRKIAILGSTNDQAVVKLSQALGLPLINQAEPQFDFLLQFVKQKLSLFWRKDPQTTQFPKDYLRLCVDFLSGALRHRSLYGGGKKQLIAKACGFKPGLTPKILDITAGLGRDAFVLAQLGAEVLMLEQHPIIAALLQDGLERIRLDAKFSNLKLNFLPTDARQFLKQAEKKFEVIYFDPMFPARDKTALVKKDMQILQALLADANNYLDLFQLAREKCLLRLVVKRPLHADFLVTEKPAFQISGKTCRFDIYLP